MKEAGCTTKMKKQNLPIQLKDSGVRTREIMGIGILLKMIEPNVGGDIYTAVITTQHLHLFTTFELPKKMDPGRPTHEPILGGSPTNHLVFVDLGGTSRIDCLSDVWLGSGVSPWVRSSERGYPASGEVGCQWLPIKKAHPPPSYQHHGRGGLWTPLTMYVPSNNHLPWCWYHNI